jgi:uncharacterized protein YndB with AHSA1/START domain
MSEKDSSIVIQKTVQSPVSEVFRAFTNATALREWFCDIATTDPRPGGRIYLGWNSGNYDAGIFTKVVHDQVIEFKSESLQAPYPLLTNIALKPDNLKTNITLTQSGFLDDANGRKTADLLKGLWEKSLKNLTSVLEEGPDLRITTRPMMGIFFSEFNEQIAKELGIPVCNGTRITGLAEGLGAQKAGLQKDDVVVELAGVPQVEFGDYLTAMQGKVGGDVIKVVFYRGKEKKTVDMELSKRRIPQIPSNASELAAQIKAAQDAVDKDMDAVLLHASEEAANLRPAEKEWNTKENLAHLLHYERFLQNWINELVFSQESVSDGFADNFDPRIKATVAIYGSLQNVYSEFKKNQAEIVELVKNLPENFVKRKSTWWRMGFTLLTYCDHTKEHLKQIKVALN